MFFLACVLYANKAYSLYFQAIKIIETALKRYRSYDEYERKAGGKKLTNCEIISIVKTFLDEEGLKDIAVHLSDDLVARACMTRIRGQSTLQIQSGNVREKWIDGMLRHEIGMKKTMWSRITEDQLSRHVGFEMSNVRFLLLYLGTHYIRGFNNKQQIWKTAKKRKELKMEPANPTEEGLASLNTVLLRDEPCLIRAAMLYYTVTKAADFSFCELFNELGKYIKKSGYKMGLLLTSQKRLLRHI